MVSYFILISTSLLVLKWNSANGDRTLYEGDQCVSHTGITGTCTIVMNCPSVLQLVKSSQNNNYVICGYHKSDQIVCCTDNLISKSNAGEPTSGIRKAAQACNYYKENLPVIAAIHILGGEVTSPGDFPHMVAVGYMVENQLGFLCGGTLISKRFVLTAAHCIKNRVKPHLVRMGTIDISPQFNGNNFKDYMIEDTIAYPAYVRSLKYNDIALLRLGSDVKLTDYIVPACLSTDFADPTEKAYVTGWGVTNIRTKERSTKLLSASLNLLALDICNDTYLELKVDSIPNGIIDSQLCAYDPKGKNDTCEGDSGGPLQIAKVNGGTYTVVGVTSFSVSCGVKPGVYTRVSRFLDWIESIVWPDELVVW